MTWKKLAKYIIESMTEEQQDQDVTVRVGCFDAYFGKGDISLQITVEEEDVLDSSSYYLDVE